jgi:hypothetical protein
MEGALALGKTLLISFAECMMDLFSVNMDGVEHSQCNATAFPPWNLKAAPPITFQWLEIVNAAQASDMDMG